MNMLTIKCRLTFTEELLGTASNNPEIHSEFVASKGPDALSREEEVAAIGVDEAVEKAMTVFPRNAANLPILFDYQVKGFFKDACGMSPAPMPARSRPTRRRSTATCSFPLA